MPSLVEIDLVNEEVCQCIFEIFQFQTYPFNICINVSKINLANYIINYIRSNQDVLLAKHKFRELKSLDKNAKFCYVFSLFCFHLPLEKGGALHLNTFEFLTPKKAICQVWLKLAEWLWRRKFENEVITTGMKSAGIHLPNYYSFRHTQPCSYLDKLTGSILQFVVLALWSFWCHKLYLFALIFVLFA